MTYERDYIIHCRVSSKNHILTLNSLGIIQIYAKSPYPIDVAMTHEHDYIINCRVSSKNCILNLNSLGIIKNI